MGKNNRIDWNQAEKILEKYLNDFEEYNFTANFPVCDIVDYFDYIFGEWIDIDSNNSGHCHDMWFSWRNDNDDKFTISFCTYHGDVQLQKIEKDE